MVTGYRVNRVHSGMNFALNLGGKRGCKPASCWHVLALNQHKCLTSAKGNTYAVGVPTLSVSSEAHQG